MATIHISEAEAAANFAALMAHINAGEQVVIERDSKPVAVLTPSATSMPPRETRTVNETLERFKALEAKRGESLRMGSDFADDMDEILRNRKPSVYENWWD